jgi:hypothetical protein
MCRVVFIDVFPAARPEVPASLLADEGSRAVTDCTMLCFGMTERAPFIRVGRWGGC